MFKIQYMVSPTTSDDITFCLDYDAWNDYGHKTRFPIDMYHRGNRYSLGAIKILFEEDAINCNDCSMRSSNPCANSHKKIGNLLEFIAAGNNHFDYADKYVSVIESDDLFDKIHTIFRTVEEVNSYALIREFIEVFHEAGCVGKIKYEYDVSRILTSKPFKDSLLRELSSRKSYKETLPKHYERRGDLDYSFEIKVKRRSGEFIPVDINFSKDILPYNVNVLIGKNGVGKTRTLESLVQGLQDSSSDWNADNDSILSGFPAFRNIVYYSYSPFDNFDWGITSGSNKRSFIKFGIKNEEAKLDIKRPEIDAAKSLLIAFQKDVDSYSYTDEYRHYKFIKEVLASKAGIDFDDIYFTLPDGSSVDEAFTKNIGGRQRVAAHIAILMKLLGNVDKKRPTVLVKDDKVVKLSSGQKMFYYITCCLIGYIGNQTLVIMDEPESYLHPTLEIVLMRILKEFLEEFNSYALIATHSMVMAREVPANRVLVLSNPDGELRVDRPQFETFGAGLEKICSHVFDDYRELPPAYQWAKDYLKNYDKDSVPQEFLERLSLEMLAYVNWDNDNGL